MRFETRRKVRFAECDPAGIVFFPQYLVMVHNNVEQWFDDALGLPYASFIGARRSGLPTVRLEVDFSASSRHGDVLTLALAVAHLGRSSLILEHSFSGADGPRLRARQVLVCTSLDTHRPQALPQDLRDAATPYLETSP